MPAYLNSHNFSNHDGIDNENFYADYEDHDRDDEDDEDHDSMPQVREIKSLRLGFLAETYMSLFGKSKVRMMYIHT